MEIRILKLDFITDSWWKPRLSNKEGDIYFVCVHMRNMEKIQTTYPSLVKNKFIKFEDKEFVIVAPVSNNATVKDGQKINEKVLFWCDPKVLIEFGIPSYFPFKKYLFVEERPAWISGSICVKQKIERIV